MGTSKTPQKVDLKTFDSQEAADQWVKEKAAKIKDMHQKNLDKIDAKYDAKIAALDTQTSEVAAGNTYKGLNVINTTDIVNNEGKKGAASYNASTKTIKVNRSLLEKKFEEQAWTNPRDLIETLHGVKTTQPANALPADQFKTYQEWENFVMEHERQHSLLSRAEFNATVPFDTHVSDYENEINQRALASIEADTTSVTAKDTKSVSNTIAMFQKGIKAENEKQIDVKYVETVLNNDEFDRNPC